MSRCSPCCSGAIKGPAVLTGVGCVLVLLGAVPFIIALTTGRKGSSLALIGLGFMGFGSLLVASGLCWCLVVCVRQRVHGKRKQQQQHTAKSKSSSSHRHSEQTRTLRSVHEVLKRTIIIIFIHPKTKYVIL